jgi:hypothetical protein
MKGICEYNEKQKRKPDKVFFVELAGRDNLKQLFFI